MGWSRGNHNNNGAFYRKRKRKKPPFRASCLIPCPRCRGKRLGKEAEIIMNRQIIRVICRDCGNRGPKGFHWKNAVSLWGNPVIKGGYRGKNELG